MDASKLVVVTEENRKEYLAKGVPERFVVSRVYIHGDRPATTNTIGEGTRFEDARRIANIAGVGSATYIEIDIQPVFGG